MIKTLLKKQLTEIFKSYFVDSKKNKARSRASTVLYFVLFAFLMLFISCSIFGALGFALTPVVTLGFGWLYYAVIGLIAVLFGVFGSVFSTYSGLYLARDNDQILSMPIPVRAIMISRLLGVYLMGLLYSATVILPTVVIRFVICGTNTKEIAGAVLFTVLISLFVLALSCIFGYLVAKVSLKLKNKSFIVVIFALLFFAAYYYVYFNANRFLSGLIKNIEHYGDTLKDKAYFVYIIGAAAEGKVLPLVIVSAVVLAVLFVTLFVISRSFIKIATGTASVSKVKYKAKRQGEKSQLGALFSKELKRFTSSPNYMLNCALGTVFMVAAGIFILIKCADVRKILEGFAYGDLITVGVCAAMSLMISMNDTATPSVSLEGKTLWQLRSLPVDTKTVLKSKYLLEMCINIIPSIFLVICICIALKTDVITGVLLVLFTLADVLFYGFFDLYCGLHKVNLNWTNEVIPIKQGVNVLIALFGGFGITIALALPFLAIGAFIGAKIYIAVMAVLLFAISALLYRWINNKGVKIFEKL